MVLKNTGKVDCIAWKKTQTNAKQPASSQSSHTNFVTRCALITHPLLPNIPLIRMGFNTCLTGVDQHCVFGTTHSVLQKPLCLSVGDSASSLKGGKYHCDGLSQFSQLQKPHQLKQAKSECAKLTCFSAFAEMGSSTRMGSWRGGWKAASWRRELHRQGRRVHSISSGTLSLRKNTAYRFIEVLVCVSSGGCLDQVWEQQ